MKAWRWTLALTLGAAAVLYLALGPLTRPDRARLSAPAPDFELARADGGLARLSDYRGKVVLVDFWATWCPSCQEEMPALEDIYRRRRGQGFELLAVSVDEGGRRAVTPFAAKHSLSFPILLADDKVASAYGVFGLPTANLLDGDGVIARRYVGPIDARVLENDILSLLNRRSK